MAGPTRLNLPGDRQGTIGKSLWRKYIINYVSSMISNGHCCSLTMFPLVLFRGILLELGSDQRVLGESGQLCGYVGQELLLQTKYEICFQGTAR